MGLFGRRRRQDDGVEYFDDAVRYANDDEYAVVGGDLFDGAGPWDEEDAPEDGFVDLIVNPSNCVQCGAITAKGGRLTPPEGGDGPVYQIT